MSRSALARLQPYAQAIIAVAIATLIRLWMDPWLHGGQIFSWYYVAVALGAWCGGWRCSLLAAVLGYVAADWFFIEPRNSFSAVNQLLGLASYVSVCGAIASCTEAIRRRSPALALNPLTL